MLRKNPRLWVPRLWIGLFCLTVVCGWEAADAHAYVRTLTQRQSSSRFTFSFTSMPRAASSIRVTVSVYGDYNSSNENATVTIDGLRQSALLTGDSQCNTTVTTNKNRRIYTVSSIYANDGRMTVSIATSSAVSPTLCDRTANSDRAVVTISYTDSTSSRPDLTVSSFSSSKTSFRAGERITLNYRVRNTQPRSATSFFVRFYYSTDSVITTADTVLGTVFVPSLGASAYYPSTGNGRLAVTIPSNAVGGRRYLGMIVDYSSRVTELSETNNTRSYSVNVLTNQPELRMLTFFRPSTVIRGSFVPVSFRVRNDGGGNAGSFSVNFYYSRSTSTTSGLSYLGAYTVSAGLATLTTSPYYTTNLRIPTNALIGRGYLHYYVDSSNRVRESNESNNRSYSSITVTSTGPDLSVTSCSLSPTTVEPGVPATARFQVRNNSASANASAFYVGIYWSTSTSSTATWNLLATQYVASLNRASSSSLSRSVTFPTSLGVGRRYLRCFVDYSNRVAETNETNNIRFASFTGRANTRPDLQMYTFDRPFRMIRGVTTPISFRIRNNSAVRAGAFSVAFYYGTSTSTSGLTFLGRYTVSAGLAGSTISPYYTTTLRLPTSAATGIRYLHYFVDYLGQVAEVNESNNRSYSSISVASSSGVNLLFSSCSVTPTSMLPGATISVRAQVRNSPATLTASSFYINVAWGDSPSLSGTWNSITSYRVSSLGRNATSPVYTLSGRLPSTIPAGRRYIRCFVDSNRSLAESNELDNYRYLPITVRGTKPELRFTYFTTSTTTGRAGTRVTFGYRIQNIGSAIPRSFQIRFYYSADATITTSDTQLAVVTVPSLGAGAYYPSSNGRVVVTLPTTVAPGTRYLGGFVDAGGNVSELTETNNISFRSITITGPPTQPDLFMRTWSATSSAAGAGAEVSITFSVSNPGKAAGAFKVGFYYGDSTSTAGLISLGSSAIASLAAGQNTPTRIVKFKLPNGVATGTRALHYFVDMENKVTESNEANNRGSRPLTITGLPDLQVKLLTAKPTAQQVGKTVQVEYRLTNIGAARAENFVLRFYLSQDAAITSADTYLGQQVTTTRLDAKTDAPASANGKVTLTLPATAKPGTYYLGAFVDYNTRVREFNEANNTKSVTIQVQPPKRPDLVATALNANPTSTSAGATVSLSYEVANRGSDDAGPFKINFYFSANATINTIDQLLKSVTVTGVKQGQSTKGTISVTMPAALPKGAAYIGMIADVEAKVTENDENNNIKSVQIAVRTDKDKDGFTDDVDCDDNDKDINPKAKEVCDNKDNNCDGKTDENLVKSCYSGPIGTAGQGVCKEGKQTCSAGNWGKCQQEVLPSKEVCDGLDNDCDGQVDSPNCPKEKAGETVGETLVADAGGEQTQPDAASPENTPEAGKCYTQGCPQNQICWQGRCIANPCDGVQCPVGDFCRDGKCMTACGCKTCSSGEKCVDGQCTKDNCAGVTCNSGEICDSSNGQCIKDACTRITCAPKMKCVLGQCVDDPCSYVQCPQGMQCNLGQCSGGQCGEPTTEPSIEPATDAGVGNDNTASDTNAPADAGSDASAPDNDQGTDTGNAPKDEGTQVVDRNTGGNDPGGNKPDMIKPPSDDGCGCQTTSNISTPLFFSCFLFLLLAFRRRSRR